MRAQHEHTQDLQIIVLLDLADREEIAQRLGHLAVVDIQERVVQPVVGKRNAVAALGLGDLILMMREDQVFSACVDVYGVPKIMLCHDGALDVPAGSSVAPRRFPVRLSFLLRLPENKIQRIFLLVLAGYQQAPAAGSQVIQILVGQFSVFFKLSGTEINCSVLLIRIVFRDQIRDHRDHAADLFRRAGMCGSGTHIHVFHVLLALFDITLGYFLSGDPFLDGFLDDLVVHVGKVRYIVDLIALMLQIAAQGIEHDHRTRVSDMNKIIYRRSADIDGNLARDDRYELFFFLS